MIASNVVVKWAKEYDPIFSSQNVRHHTGRFVLVWMV